MSDYEVEEITGWDGQERRHIDGVALRLMVEFRKQMEMHEKQESAVLDEIKSEIRENRASSERRHDELAARFEQMQKSSMSLLQANNQTTNEIHKLFKAAFPDGDADAHRKAHEAWIEKSKADREFWVKLKQDVVKWAVIAILGWVGIVLWAAFVRGPTP